MKSVRYISTLLLIALVLSGCEDKLDPQPFTYSQLFTGSVSKTWKLTLIEVTEEGKVVDRFAIDCAKDDQYTFHASSDRLYEFTSGSNLCSDDETDFLDSWSFNNATATFSFILPIFSTSQAINFIVRKADKNDFTLEVFLDEEGKESYRIHFVLEDEG